MITLGMIAVLMTASELPLQYPLDDLVILEHETNIVLTSEHTVERRERIVRTPLTLAGREDYSDIRIPYNDPMQELRILVCRTTGEDGSSIDAESHAFVPVTPSGYGHALDFIGFREMVISPPGVDEGSKTELMYSITDSTSRYPWWESSIGVGQHHPVVSRTIRIENPSEFPLRWKLINVEGVEPVRDGTSIEWTFNDIPAYPVGASGPRAYTRVPRLIVTTCPSWAAASEWLYAELIAGRTVPGEAADSLAGKLEDTITLEDSLHAVLAVVNTFSEHVPTPDLRFRNPRGFQRILETGYADAWERLAFTAAMVRDSGLEAQPCLVGPVLNDDTPPVLALFDSRSIRIPGERPKWVGTSGIRPWPVRHGEFSVLPIVEKNGTLLHEQGIGECTGFIRCKIIAEREDSISIRGEAVLSPSLVPIGHEPGKPDSWLSHRVESLIDGLTGITIAVREAGTDGGRYTFNAGCTIGTSATITLKFEDLFGSEWVPPRSHPHTAAPRIPVDVPFPVLLSMDLRIRSHESWDIIPPVAESVEQTTASYQTTVNEIPGELRIRRRITLDRGWYDGEKMDELRLTLSREGQNAARNVFILR